MGVPLPSQKGNYGIVTVSPKLNLLSTEGRATLGKTYKDVQGSKLPTFEALRQRSGFVLYETILTRGDGLLRIEQPRDLIFVFVDGVSFFCILLVHNKRLFHDQYYLLFFRLRFVKNTNVNIFAMERSALIIIVIKNTKSLLWF